MHNRLFITLGLTGVVGIGLAGCNPPGPSTRPVSAKLTAGPEIAFAPGVEVPQPTQELPLLQLSAQTAPNAMIESLLREAHPNAQLRNAKEDPLFRARPGPAKPPEDMLTASEGEQLLARIDLKGGEARLYPNLSKLTPFSPNELDAMEKRASSVLNSRDFIVADDTERQPVPAQSLRGATWSEGGKVPEVGGARLMYFKLRRTVKGLPVDGPGSRAAVGVGAQSAVHGLVRSWQKATQIDIVKPQLTVDQVKDAIRAQLRNARDSVLVTRIDLVYYDGQGRYLQPAYRFFASIGQAGVARFRSIRGVTPRDQPYVPRLLTGYVAVGELKEPLPTLGGKPSVTPGTPTAKPGDVPAPEPGDPIIGRYVVQNDDPAWIDDANAFWDTLSHSPAAASFTNAQYFYTEPSLFTARKDTFINGMHLALTEAHGSFFFINTTTDCCANLVNMRDVPPPGYGPRSGVGLTDWVIHSCEVIPAPEDVQNTGENWVDSWRTVFGGMRHVVGYRTPMYITDGASAAYASELAAGASVVNSWLQTVGSLNIYVDRPTIETHTVVRPLGMPSALSVCGLEDESVFSPHTLPINDCIRIYWMSDDGSTQHQATL